MKHLIITVLIFGASFTNAFAQISEQMLTAPYSISELFQIEGNAPSTKDLTAKTKQSLILDFEGLRTKAYSSIKRNLSQSSLTIELFFDFDASTEKQFNLFSDYYLEVNNSSAFKNVKLEKIQKGAPHSDQYQWYISFDISDIDVSLFENEFTSSFVIKGTESKSLILKDNSSKKLNKLLNLILTIS